MTEKDQRDYNDSNQYDAPTNEQSETQKSRKLRSHDAPLSLYPLTEDEALRRLIAAGPLPEKQRPSPTSRAEPHVASEPTRTKHKSTRLTGHKKYKPKQ